jgi:hypothetical protein
LQQKIEKEWYEEIGKQLIEPSYEDEEEQKRVLGEFNKNGVLLPIRKGDLFIEMFALNSNLYTEGEKKRLTKLEPDKRYVECLLGLSGIGKTFHMQARATQEFCIFISACGETDSRASLTAFSDRSYYDFLGILQTYDSSMKMFAFVEDEINIFLIARLIHLVIAIKKFPGLTSAKFYAMQVNGEQSPIKYLYKLVREYLLGVPSGMLKDICLEIVQYLKNMNVSQIGMILDEANAAATSYIGW